MNMLKSKGPKIDPCGIENFILLRYFYVPQSLLFDGGSQARQYVEAIQIKSTRLKFYDKKVMR